uniref:uncharacterized protein LOC105757692 n=1 Tax=Odobenus rosmarus divergens TaxID=9708 RepID=UPI00063C6EC2|nr:PREDICTED: uncharacterized protein LOC105757692 [Odobenus rosmarus divergens]
MCSDISDLSGGMREGSPGEIQKFKARSGRGSGARRRGGEPASGGLGWQDLPKAAISLLISLYFWRERHLSHPLFLSAHPCSLPLIYLSKSLIFCISEEDVNGKEFPLSARAPRGGDAQEGSPSGARDEGCWCQKERMIDEKQTPGYRHSSFCFRY